MRNLVCVLAVLFAPLFAFASEPRLAGSHSIGGWFEPNQGQADPAVRFIGRGGGATLLIAADGSATFAGPAAARMTFAGAREAAGTAMAERLPGESNYLIGNVPSKWRTNVPHYGRVELRDVYSGIDLVYRGAGTIEYDLIVKPGGDPRAIRLHFDAVDEVRIADSGDLVLRSGGTEIVQRVPVVYQEFRGARERIRGAYVLRSKSDVAFEIGAYDPSRPVVIDPVLVASTRVGTSNEWTEGSALDASGNLYLCGMTYATGSPKFGPGGAPFDGFVAKFNSAQVLQFITYIGGNNEDYLASVVVDGQGNAYVCGDSRSTDFPVVPVGEGQGVNAGVVDAVVLKLDSGGSSLSYSNYIGGSAFDNAAGIVVNNLREVFLTGSALSTDFPSYSPCPGNVDAWVAKLDFWGRIVWINCVGGVGHEEAMAIAIDSSGTPSIAGYTTSTDFPVSSNAMQKTNAGLNDIFFAVLNSNGSIAYSTLWGGSGDDQARAVQVDRDGRFYVAGSTKSPNFPVVGLGAPAGNSDAFVMKFMLPNIVIYSGAIGGAANDVATTLEVDDAGCAYVGGETASGAGFPTKDSLFAPAGGIDVFLTKLGPAGATVYSTLIGGSGSDRWALVQHQPSTTYTYLIGQTGSADFPLVPPPGGGVPAGQTFIAKIDDGVKYSAVGRVVATATASMVHVTWAAVTGATKYTVVRYGVGGGSGVATDVGLTLAWDDNSVAPGNAYLYRVQAADASGASGPLSECDLAVVFTATDDPAVAGATPVKAVQVQEVRAAIDKARALKSLAPYAYTNSVAAGSVIRGIDFAELQSAANEARIAIPLPRFRFTSLYSPDSTILAVHLNELRQSIR